MARNHVPRTPKFLSAQLSRRQLLRLTGAAGAASFLVACAPAASPGAAEPSEDAGASAAAGAGTEAVNITIMMFPGELVEAELDQFNADYEGMTLERIDPDETRFYAMLASGTPPDIFRVQAPSVPQLIGRNIALNLQPYVDVSEFINNDDLAPANNYYRAGDAFSIGEGDIYGVVKDWSEDFTMWVNASLFEEMGISAPDDTQAMSYTELAALAAQATKVSGDKTEVMGYLHNQPWIMRSWMLILLEQGMSIFADDFSRLILSESEEALQAVRWFFDLAAEGHMNSPLNPTVVWAGADFLNRLGAIVQSGYWFTGFIANNTVEEFAEDKYMHIPAPSWTGERVSPTHAATGAIIVAESPNPDQAWAAFEWYNAKEPAITRAKSGWGIPALKSFYEMLPEETPLQAQAKRVMLAEIQYSDATLAYNPFLLKSEPDAISAAYDTHLEPALLGDITFEQMIENIENEVNLAIQDGIERLGV